MCLSSFFLLFTVTLHLYHFIVFFFLFSSVIVVEKNEIIHGKKHVRYLPSLLRKNKEKLKKKNEKLSVHFIIIIDDTSRCYMTWSLTFIESFFFHSVFLNLLLFFILYHFCFFAPFKNKILHHKKRCKTHNVNDIK